VKSSILQYGIFLALLRITINFLEPRTSINRWLDWAYSRFFIRKPPDVDAKAPAWISDVYFIITFTSAILGINLATNTVTCLSLLFIFIVIWPLYRLYEFALFVIGWIFVHSGPLRSIRRSLFGFFLNLFEIAILTTTLEIVIEKSNVVDRWSLVFDAFTKMISITPPSVTSESFVYLIELTRFGFGVLLMLCVIGALAGNVVRRSWTLLPTGKRASWRTYGRDAGGLVGDGGRFGAFVGS